MQEWERNWPNQPTDQNHGGASAHSPALVTKVDEGFKRGPYKMHRYKGQVKALGFNIETVPKYQIYIHSINCHTRETQYILKKTYKKTLKR